MGESGRKLYACATHLPLSGSGEFVEIYDFGSGVAEPVSVAVLNDRAVIACGDMSKPLVFLGGLDPSGADWAVPKVALISYDSGKTFHDIGREVLDSDPDTSFDLSEIAANSGQIYICTDVSGVSGFLFDASGQSQSGTVVVEGYSGAWGNWADVGITDNTSVSGKTLAQSGTIQYDDVFAATYHTIFEQAGFWHRVSFPSGCSDGVLSRILYQAPCQPLQVIGDGQPVMPVSWVFYDTSAENAKDWTPYVTDFTHPSVARLNDGASSGAVGMQSGDWIYVCGLTQFDEMEWMPGNDNYNSSGASGLLQYWNGYVWSNLAFTDGTMLSGKVSGTSLVSAGAGYSGGDVLTLIDDTGLDATINVNVVDASGGVDAYAVLSSGYGYSSGTKATSGGYGSGCTIGVSGVTAGVTLSQKGRMSWEVPGDWRQNRPINQQFPLGYWVRYGVTGPLTSTTTIAECYLYPVPEEMVNYKHTTTLRDRVVLANRPDARDQLGITRSLEEYGMTGEDSYSLRVGGQDEIVGIKELFNQNFIAKTDCIHILNGYTPKTFASERAETGGQAPINNRVMIPAAVVEADSKNKMGLYFINQFGAWVFTGLQVYELSAEVNWWNPAADNPRLDLNNLWRSCGVYWPERSWIIWAVPMIVGETSSQATNNALIIYDLSLGTFLPPRLYAAASLCTAYHYAEDAPGHRGEIGLYAGDYSGGISRVFGPTANYVSGWGEMGWLAFGAPKIVKELRGVTAYGKGAVTIDLYTNGNEDTVTKSWSMSGLASIGTRVFAVDDQNKSIKANFFKPIITLGSGADLYGITLEFSPVRGWSLSR